jgi:hypothetical protein
MQIRNMLLDLDYLSSLFQIEAPPRGVSREDLYTWIDQVMTEYKALPYHIIWTDQQEEPITIPKGAKMQRAKENEVITLDGDIVTVKTKRGLHERQIPIGEFLFPGERLLGDGLRKHPVLALWYGYTDALAEYINAHVYEWIARGYKNNMLVYDLPEKIDYPEWVSNPEFHRSMRARLREKEKQWFQEYEAGERKQKPELWYTASPFFTEAGEDTGYLW